MSVSGDAQRALKNNRMLQCKEMGLISEMVILWQTELMNRMAVSGVLKRNRLSWFGHVERKENGLSEEFMYMEVEGARSRGRPRKTW